MQKYLVEALGTFFLVITIALAGDPIAIGAILIAMVYMGAYISGAHYNPAVTLGMVFVGKMKPNEAVRYIIAQLIGAILAASLFYAMAQQPFIPAANEQLSFWLAFVCEVIFTFALVSVVLHVALPDRVKNNFYYGAAIGLTVMAGATAVGPISGAVFNPAVGVGPLLVDAKEFVGHGTKLLMYLANYLVAPVIGSLLAAISFRYLQKAAK